MSWLTESEKRRIRIGVPVLMLVLAAAFNAAYFTAASYLYRHDPRRSGNAVGTIVFASPVRVFREQRVGRAALVAHLHAIGFQEGDGVAPGTYALAAHKLAVRSRLPELEDLVLTFDAKDARVLRVEAKDGAREEAYVEPETLGSRIIAGEDGRLKPVRRRLLQPQELERTPLRDAVLASEDKSFDAHHGVDFLAMLRAPLEGRGASTITMQVARNVVLQDQRPTLARKAKEIMLALAMRRFSRAEVFQAYANNIYLGQTKRGGLELRGFAAAAEEYFGKPIADLTPGEAATLGGLVNAPYFYYREACQGRYERLRARRDRVLDLMARNYPDRYDAELIARAKAESVSFVFASARASQLQLDTLTEHFQQYVSESLDRLDLPREVIGEGLHLYTTLDASLQRVAQSAVTRRLDALDPPDRSAAQGGARLQAALVALDRKGRVLCLVGDRDGRSDFNRATKAQRSTGSGLKPFVYALALARGIHDGRPFNAATVLDPRRDPVDDYRPEGNTGGAARARVLLARSDNGGATVALHDAGLDAGRELLARLLDAGEVERTGMIALGGTPSTATNPLTLASAYTVLMTGGTKLWPTPFSAVYANGQQQPLPAAATAHLLNEEETFVATQMLKSVAGRGPDGEFGSARAALAGLPTAWQLAAKTGTSENGDWWCIVVTPQMVAVVWVGADDSRPLPREKSLTGGGVAAPVLRDFLTEAGRTRPDLLRGSFAQPRRVLSLPIDTRRGCLAGPGGRPEFFIEGRLPPACQ